jgi:CheY-like chemotaxis protein
MAGETMPSYYDDSKENDNDSSSDQRTILLVDDDPMIIEMLECVIQAHGIQVVIATDGFEACRTFLAEPERFDLLVSDVQMPNMNGIEAYKIMTQVEPRRVLNFKPSTVLKKSINAQSA